VTKRLNLYDNAVSLKSIAECLNFLFDKLMRNSKALKWGGVVLLSGTLQLYCKLLLLSRLSCLSSVCRLSATLIYCDETPGTSTHDFHCKVAKSLNC